MYSSHRALRLSDILPVLGHADHEISLKPALPRATLSRCVWTGEGWTRHRHGDRRRSFRLFMGNGLLQPAWKVHPTPISYRIRRQIIWILDWSRGDCLGSTYL